MSIEQEFEEIFQGEYRKEVLEEYRSYRHSQFISALTTAIKNAKDMGVKLPSEIADFLGKEDNLDSIDKLVGEGNIDKALRWIKWINKETDLNEFALVRYLIEYGKANNVSAKDVVRNTKALSSAVKKVYGSVENYKEGVKDNLKMWYERAGSIKKIDGFISKAVLAGLKLADRDLYNVVKPIVDFVKDNSDKATALGQEIVRQYGSHRAKEIESLMKEE